jgi:adenosylhomocysteinase
VLIAFQAADGGAHMDTLDSEKARRFFSRVVGSRTPGTRPAAVVVTHLLPDRPFLIEAISSLANIGALLPKPKTSDIMVQGWLQHKVPIFNLRRSTFNDPTSAVSFLRETIGDQNFVLIDIGGYFAQCALAIHDEFGDRFLGVIEDTENGVQKYEAVELPPVPVIHVARSPLKNPEDFLVGQSIVFSVEAILREQGDIIHGRTACVIGYGKLGRSIANLLHARHVRTIVYDTDPIKRIEAMSHGFAVSTELIRALVGAGLVFCATGNMALRGEEFEALPNGCYIATVTSSDDELDLSHIDREYNFRHRGSHILEYYKPRHQFFVLNRGQAVNFIHGAAVGPFIYLVHGEIVAALKGIIDGGMPPGLSELSVQARKEIADAWHSEFGPKDVK